MKPGGAAAVILVLALLAAMALHAAHFYPRLPDQVASSFGTGGQPQGWSSKEALMWIHAAATALMAAIALGGPAAVARLPTTMINLPHKEYWLAPERREASLRVISGYLLWTGVATLLLLFLIMDGVFRANLEPGGRLGDAFLVYVGIYMTFVFVSTGWLVTRFGRRPET